MRSFKLHLSWPIVLLAAAAITVISGGHVVHADDPAPEGAQEAYLVKLPQGQGNDLVQWVNARGGSVLDVHTMRELTGHRVAPTQPEPVPMQPEASQTRPADPTSLPRLASGLETYKALFAALDAAGSAEAATDPGAIRLDRVAINDRRMSIRVRVRKVELLDRVRRALEAHPLLRARFESGAGRVEMGSMSRLKDDTVRSELTLRFESQFHGRRAKPGDAQEPVDALAETRVHAASAAAGTRMLRATAIRRDAIRKLGISLQSREYTFDTASLKQLLALIQGLEAGTGAVTAVRYELLPPKEQMVGKSPRTGRVQIILTQVVPLAD